MNRLIYIQIQIHTSTYKQTDKLTDVGRDGLTNKQIEIQMSRLIYIEDRLIYIQIGRQMDRCMYRQVDEQADGKTNR